MIRTIIEVEGKEEWDYEKQLKAALDKIGYEPKPSEEEVRWRSDLFSALREMGLSAGQIVDKYRSDRFAIDLGREITPNQATS